MRYLLHCFALYVGLICASNLLIASHFFTICSLFNVFYNISTFFRFWQLSPYLFIIFMTVFLEDVYKDVLQEFQHAPHVHSAQDPLLDLEYADDVILIPKSQRSLNFMIARLQYHAKLFGMIPNKTKTVVLVINEGYIEDFLDIHYDDGTPVKQVAASMYLGALIRFQHTLLWFWFPCVQARRSYNDHLVHYCFMYFCLYICLFIWFFILYLFIIHFYLYVYVTTATCNFLVRSELCYGHIQVFISFF